jgi:hypothetical protein
MAFKLITLASGSRRSPIGLAHLRAVVSGAKSVDWFEAKVTT